MVPPEWWVRKTPGVLGGEACVRGTRIAVWVLVESRRLGRSDTELLADHSELTTDDLSATRAYFETHPQEIEIAIRANNDAE